MKRCAFLFLLLAAPAAWAASPPNFVEDPAAENNFREAFDGIGQHLHDGNGSARLHDVLPDTDSMFDLGSLGREWQRIYVDLVQSSTITASSATLTNLTSSSATISNLTATTGTITSLTATTATLTNAVISRLDADISSYRRPTLVWVSTNSVDMSSNTATTNQSCILFGDGNYRCVTEDTASADKYRRFIASATAEFTSGTEESGLRSGYTRTANTWYSLYAVKSAINSSNFVIVGDTITATPANYTTLNSAYGTDGWVYLGLIRNGDNSANTTQILKFRQTGALTTFVNSATIGSAVSGTRLANTAGATSLTYTYASGTGASQVPDVISNITGIFFATGVANDRLVIRDSTDAIAVSVVAAHLAGAGFNYHFGPISVKEGFRLSLASSTSTAFSIGLAGFFDDTLATGTP